MKENETLETTKPADAPDFENGATIEIKFSVPDTEGNVQTSVDAKGMSIQHFKHLASVANWYIANEFSEEEQEKIAKMTADSIAENTEEHN